MLSARAVNGGTLGGEPVQLPKTAAACEKFCATLRRMEQRKSTLVALYKVFRWVVLAVFLLVLVALLRRPAPVAPEATPQAVEAHSRDFDTKLQGLSDAHERGESSEARFSAEEVNAAITRTMQESAQPVAAAAAAAAAAPRPTTTEPPADEPATPGTPDGAPVRTVQVAFQENEVTGQFATEIYGQDMYITIAGRLASKGGYVTFEPTVFKVGNLAVPVSWVNDALQKKLAEPENREKLKLPDFIAGLRVENGELVITQK